MSARVEINLPDRTCLVSVVIPAFNAERTIDDTLNSVRGQTHRQLEIIVVNDGSTDETGSIVDSHIAADARVRLISQGNRGVATARNIGWRSAHSDLIAFIDADDLWSPSKISRQLEVMLPGGEEMGLVYTWFAIVDERNLIRFFAKGRHISGNVLLHTFQSNFVGHGSSALIRRRALIEAGGFEPELSIAGSHGCEDWLLYYRIARHFQFGLVPDYLTGYRVISSGRMSGDAVRMLRSCRTVGSEMKRNYPEHVQAIDAGIRAYVEFLARQSIRSHEFGQLRKLLSLWIAEHPWDFVRVPLSLAYSAAIALLRAEVDLIRGHKLRKNAASFPIG